MKTFPSSPGFTSLGTAPEPSRTVTSIAAAPSLRALINGNSNIFPSAEAKFRTLANEWRKYNAGSSVIDYHHAAYAQIIGMGMSIVPTLLGELDNGDTSWVLALKYISGAKVTNPEMRGNRDAIRAAWLRWGAENGQWAELRR